MKTAYGVIWRERDVEETGRIEVGPQSVRLSDFEDAPRHEIRFDEITAVEVRELESQARRALLVLRLREGRTVEIESAVDKWIASDLLEAALGHIVARERDQREILLAVRLRPGSREAARELLRTGPPFDPADTTLVLHEVFLLDDEALFLFQTHEGGQSEQPLEINVWQAMARWRELATEVRLAEPVYAWARRESVPVQVRHPGLGY